MHRLFPEARIPLPNDPDVIIARLLARIDALRTALANLVDEVAAQPLADDTGELAARLDEARALLAAPGRGTKEDG